EFHRDAWNTEADTARVNRQPRIVHCTNASRFRESVSLQHGNPEHQEELLRFGRKRCRAANERSQVRPEALLDGCEDCPPAQGQPKYVGGSAAAHTPPLPGITCLREKGTNRSRALCQVFLNTTAHALQQGGDVEKIVRRSEKDFVGKLIEVCRKGQLAFAGK